MSTFFLAQETLSGPHMNRLKRFCELIRFLENIRLKSSKITCLRSQRLREHASLALGNPPFKIFLNIAIGYVNTPKYFF